MPLGDAAGWTTAIFTGLLAVIAYFQLGGQRKELKNVGNQLDALKAEQIKLELAAQSREEYQVRTGQAQKIRMQRNGSMQLLIYPGAPPTSYSYLKVTNESDQPIYTVEVAFGDQLAFDIGQLDLSAPEPRPLEHRRRRTLAEIGPGETWYFLVYVGMGAVEDPGVCAWFTDANGVQWRKNLVGQLDEIPPSKPPRPDQDNSLQE